MPMDPSAASAVVAPGGAPVPLWRLLIDASIFGVVGIILLIVGYYVWELVTPYNVRKELQENKNVAVAIVVAAFILGMAIVVAASLLLISR
jgi:uncharacterized membrane protein YjfL (UPF0719 family)